MLVIFSLNEAGLHTLIAKALLPQETSRVELLLLHPSALWLATGKPPASLLTTCVCEQNSLNAKGQGGMKKLAFATNP